MNGQRLSRNALKDWLESWFTGRSDSNSEDASEEDDSSGTGKPWMSRYWWLWFIGLLAVDFLVVALLFPSPQEGTKVPYTLFKEEVRAGNVEEIYVRGSRVEGNFKEPITYQPEEGSGLGDGGSASGGQESRAVEMFSTALPTFVDSSLEELLIENGVVIRAEPVDRSLLWSLFLLLGFGPSLLLIGVLVWLWRRAGQGGGGMGGLMGMGKSQAHRADTQSDQERVTFDDVAGIGEPTGGAAEQEQTLNQILSEMDGFSSREGVIVLAATNQPDMLDRALLRPGRFDRRITIQPPDRAGREEILKVHTRSVPLAGDVDLGEIASSTPGLTGADLRNLVNEAALTAARHEREEVHGQDFLDALERITLGPERQLLMSQEERERIAYHEGGHALLGLVVPGSDPVNRVTIIPRGGSLGVTHQTPEDDRYNYDERYLRARITGALGGRVAEEIVYSSPTTGAENDIDQVTDLARRMVTRWGMSENPYLTSG